MVVGLLLLAMLTLWLRRWLHQEEDVPAGAGFTLHDLQEFRRSGKLTDAEFEKLRAEVLAQTKAAIEKPLRSDSGDLPPAPPA